MKKRMTRILVSTLLAATVCTPLFTTTTVMAESATDPAPSITPDNANGKKILFDNTHAQTAGLLFTPTPAIRFFIQSAENEKIFIHSALVFRGVKC